MPKDTFFVDTRYNISDLLSAVVNDDDRNDDNADHGNEVSSIQGRVSSNFQIKIMMEMIFKKTTTKLGSKKGNQRRNPTTDSGRYRITAGYLETGLAKKPPMMGAVMMLRL